MKVGIIIICYNIPAEVTLLQIEALKKFCKDDFEIHIIDNSTEAIYSEAICYHVENLGIHYVKTNANSRNGSESHSFAANLSYQMLGGVDGIIAYLDHDIFPIKPFSFNEILGDKIIAGLGQGGDSPYFWAGCVGWRNDIIDKNLIDFSPEKGKDTGAGFSKIIEKYGKENCVFFNESYKENPYYSGKKYNYVSMINDEMFCHWIGASNWIKLPDNSERINSLINFTKELMDENKG